MSNDDNRIVIRTKLEGYIRVDAPGGKFNNCTFDFKIPEKNLPWFEDRYEDALTWARENFDGKRMEEAIEPWEEDGLVKYSYGGDTNKPFFAFVDDDREPITDEEAKCVGRGTEVALLVQAKPYIFGKKGGLSVRVLGGRILDLVPFGEEQIDQEEVLDDLFSFTDEDEEEAPKAKAKASTRKAKPAPEEEDELPF